MVTKDYDERTKAFQIFIGTLRQIEGLTQLVIPKGSYIEVIVKPKLGFLWGIAIGQIKRDFYRKWLPTSGFTALNLEYEYHTEASIGKKPTISLMLSVRSK